MKLWLNYWNLVKMKKSIRYTKKINFSTYSDLCFLSIHVLVCNLIMIEKTFEMYKLENIYMKNFPALPFMFAKTFSSTTQHSFCLICNFIALYNIYSVWLKNSISEYFSYAIPWNPKSQISSNYCLSKSNLNIFSLNTLYVYLNVLNGFPLLF